MRRSLVVSLLLGLSIMAARVVRAEALAAGDSVRDFSLPNYDGARYSLSQYRDKKAVVVMFIAAKCPVSNDYDARMVDLARTYGPKGVQFLGIDSNRDESADEIASDARQHGFPFPVLRDEVNIVADQFGAMRTPEVYVISPARIILYHGRIDDDQDAARVHERDLKSALDAVLVGRPVPRPETRAFGCTIKRDSPRP